MAKSSMVASTIPKSPIYHGNKDAYYRFLYFDLVEIACYIENF